jgi:tRNA A58 N-methylase Trm61
MDKDVATSHASDLHVSACFCYFYSCITGTFVNNYSPDISTIILQLQLHPGSIICESGCGSGSMSYALCRAIQPHGRLHSYDIDATRVACVQEKLTASFGADIAHVSVRNVCTDGFNVDGEEL